MVEQPTGSVTLVFTDIEGSTRLLGELGQDAYLEALAKHREVIREAFGALDGYEVDYEGDSFFYAFASARQAVEAVNGAMVRLRDGPIRLRVGIHSGKPGLDPPKYVGLDVHRAARIMSAGHGGQVLLSQTTHELLEEHFSPLRDLGEHRLKDLPEPEWLFQLGEQEFPPLKSLANTNLPAAANPLIGRERELEELTELVRDEQVRLVTLTGAGGAGKTRLGLEVAAGAVGDFPNGVFFVSLAPISDPTLVVSAVARTLGFKEQAGDTMLETLARELEPTMMLLFLDNFEQVTEAAPALAELLARAPHLKLLVTSRELLHLEAEREYPVPPLPDEDAVSLFRARATNSEPVDAVEEICRRLDGLPLAIELAAARTKVLPPTTMLGRLEQRLPLLVGKRRDAPSRQQTLRATIEWSYDLLDAREQQLFARLGAFAGGCRLEAVEEVCESNLETLESLVEKSLVRERPVPEGVPRFWMLETIREYAGEQLASSGESKEIRGRHADDVIRISERGSTQVIGLASPAWLKELDLEQDNIRSALDWLLSVRAWESFARLAGTLWPWWFVRGHPIEGRRWLREAQESPLRSDGLRGGILRGLSALAESQGDYTEARDAAEEAVRLYRRIDDRPGLARALNELGLAHFGLKDFERSAAMLEESATLARAGGDLETLRLAIGNQGQFALAQREFDRARALCEEARALSRDAGDVQGVMVTSYNIAESHLQEGELDQARLLFEEVMKMGWEWGWREGVLFPLESLAEVAVRRQEGERAARLLGAAKALREQLGHNDDRVAETRTKVSRDLGRSRFEEAFASGRTLVLEDAVAYALGAELERASPEADAK